MGKLKCKDNCPPNLFILYLDSCSGCFYQFQTCYKQKCDIKLQMGVLVVGLQEILQEAPRQWGLGRTSTTTYSEWCSSGTPGWRRATCCLSCFTYKFSMESKSTIGMEFATHSIQVDSKTIGADLWHHSQSTTSPSPPPTTGAVGTLLWHCQGPDIENVEHWLKELWDHTNSIFITLLVGNNSNLCHPRAVPTDEACAFAENNLSFIELSLGLHQCRRSFQEHHQRDLPYYITKTDWKFCSPLVPRQQCGGHQHAACYQQTGTEQTAVPLTMHTSSMYACTSLSSAHPSPWCPTWSHPPIELSWGLRRSQAAPPVSPLPTPGKLKVLAATPALLGSWASGWGREGGRMGKASQKQEDGYTDQASSVFHSRLQGAITSLPLSPVVPAGPGPIWAKAWRATKVGWYRHRLLLALYSSRTASTGTWLLTLASPKPVWIQPLPIDLCWERDSLPFSMPFSLVDLSGQDPVCRWSNICVFYIQPLL